MKSRNAEQEAANRTLPTEGNAQQRTEEEFRQGEQLVQELDAVRRLHQVSAQLIQADGSQALFDKILDAAVAVMRADYASIQILDSIRGVGGELQLVGHRGFPDEASKFWHWVRPASQSTCGMALRTGQRAIVSDIETCDFMASTADLAMFRQAGIRAVQTTPLLSRSGSILGMISTHWRNPHEPSERELQALDVLARQAADLIERRLAEAALREERFQLMADHAPVLIWMSGGDKLCTWFNKPWLEFVGRTMEQELGNGWAENVHPADFDRCLQSYTAAFDARRPFSMEYRLKRHDGEYRWVLDNGIPRYGTDGEFAGYIGSCTDITDHKQAEEALRDREARLRAILDTASDAIITGDRSGVIESVNPAAEQLFGYPAAELIGQNAKTLMAPPYRDEHDGYLARYLQTGERRILGIAREVECRRKDGSVFPADLTVSEVEPGKRFTAVLRDITHRKEMERDIVEIASLERQRIGQDLHDDIGQELTALALLAGGFVETLPEESSETIALAQRIMETAERTLRKVRSLAHGLAVDEVKPEDLPAALAELTKRLGETCKVRCVCQIDPNIHVAGSLEPTHLYHIAQEACNNSIKHARAQNVDLSLRREENAVVLQVRDNGIGMPAQPTETPGLGLRIMHNRATIIGAQLTIEPAVPTGTLVTCRLALGNP